MCTKVSESGRMQETPPLCSLTLLIQTYISFEFADSSHLSGIVSSLSSSLTLQHSLAIAPPPPSLCVPHLQSLLRDTWLVLPLFISLLRLL